MTQSRSTLGDSPYRCGDRADHDRNCHGRVAAAWPFAARAQQLGRRRIGVLVGLASDDPEGQARLAAFLQGLQEVGWGVARNVQIDYRWGAPRYPFSSPLRARARRRPSRRRCGVERCRRFRFSEFRIWANAGAAAGGVGGAGDGAGRAAARYGDVVDTMAQTAVRQGNAGEEARAGSTLRYRVQYH
jgi:hypothetical protein